MLFFRQGGSARFSERDVASLQMVAPLLADSATHAAQLVRQSRRSAMLEAMFDRVSLSMALLSADGRPLFMNSAATALVGQRKWLIRSADGAIVAANPQQAKELRLLLGELLSNEPMQVLSGAKVVEVRPIGVNKGGVVPLILNASGPTSRIIAIGDDRTDEDLFAALPASAVCLRVGDGPSLATHRFADTGEVRSFLRTYLAGRRTPVEDGLRERVAT